MKRQPGLSPMLLVAFACLCGALAGRTRPTAAAQVPNFDKLSADDRQEFQKRFEAELWPLLTRNGKEGCIGCHAGKIVTALRTTGDAAKDFRMLLKDGFFLVDDRGSLLSRIAATDPKRRMPPDDRPRWSEEEIARLRAFVIDLERKQQ